MYTQMKFAIHMGFKYHLGGESDHRKVIFVSDAYWEFKGYDAAGGGNIADGGFDSGGRH